MDPELARCLRRLGLERRDWSVAEPAHNRWLTPGIWDVTCGDERLIVKQFARRRPEGRTEYERHWIAGNDEPTRWNYWAREALAYSTGVASEFEPVGLKPPRCRGVEITADDAVVALEFVTGAPGADWKIVDYADVARALGAAQARYLLGHPMPEVSWLSQSFIRTYSSEKPVAWALLDDDAAWQQPLVAACFPAELRAAANALHHSRDRLCEVLEMLPQTLCHLDFWTNNLIRTGDTFVVLDWAFVGLGAAGEDIGNLVPDAVFDHFITPAELPNLRSAVLGGYLAGLAEAGWRGDPATVEQAMAASAVKYDWLTPLMLERAAAAEHATYGGAGTIDAETLYRSRGLALLANAEQALSALR